MKRTFWMEDQARPRRLHVMAVSVVNPLTPPRTTMSSKRGDRDLEFPCFFRVVDGVTLAPRIFGICSYARLPWPAVCPSHSLHTFQNETACQLGLERCSSSVVKRLHCVHARKRPPVNWNIPALPERTRTITDGPHRLLPQRHPFPEYGCDINSSLPRFGVYAVCFSA